MVSRLRCQICFTEKKKKKSQEENVGKVPWFFESLGFRKFHFWIWIGISELEKGAGSRYPLNVGTNTQGRRSLRIKKQNKTLNLMENIQRPDCGRDGRYVWVGGCWKDSLSTTEGMIKDYPAFKPEGQRSISWLKGEVFSLLQRPLAGHSERTCRGRWALNPDSGPGCEGDTGTGPTRGTVPPS